MAASPEGSRTGIAQSATEAFHALVALHIPALGNTLPLGVTGFSLLTPHASLLTLSFKLGQNKTSNKVLPLPAKKQLCTAAPSTHWGNSPLHVPVPAPVPLTPLNSPWGVENRLSRIMTLGCTPCSTRTLTASMTVLPVPERGSNDLFNISPLPLLKNLSSATQGHPCLHWGVTEWQHHPFPLQNYCLCMY